MPASLHEIEASDAVFRLARGPDPWAWPSWTYAQPDGTFGNRYDDPESIYRVLYAGTDRLGCSIECLARFRSDPEVLAGVAAIIGDPGSSDDPATRSRAVVWTDCRFRNGCKANDIVLSHSLNATGTSWSAVTRAPIDAVGSGVDHFIPGIAVNKATSGSAAQLGLTYYFYPKGSTALSVGFTSSIDAGNTWSSPQLITSGMTSTWAATTSQGRMVGDYISTSYGSDSLAHGIFGAANTPTTGAGTSCSTSALDNCVAAIDTFTPGLASGSLSGAADQVLFSGHGGTTAASLWNIVDNEGIRHRD